MAEYDPLLDDDDLDDDDESPTGAGPDVNATVDELDDLLADADPGTSRADARHAHALNEMDRHASEQAGRDWNANARLRELRAATEANTAAVERGRLVPLRSVIGTGKRTPIHRHNPY